ncbi:MAG: beta-phosphoglucomutase [Thermoleophilia bacterium]|nr:beta-phosphoglucomutase [Thermoleophilia bacterium]
MAIRAVIFDLDGVIVSTDAMHYKAWKSIADGEGIYFDEEINNRLRGVSRMESLEIILERAAREYGEDEKRSLAETKNARYVELLKTLTPDAVPAEVSAVLGRLQTRGLKIAVGSSSRNTPLILRRIGMEHTFDAVADGNDIERTKPAPDVFLVAARRLGVSPADCLVVEDADAGIKAAKAAGMLAAAMGDAARSSEADFVLNGIGDLPELMDDEAGASVVSDECARFIEILRMNQSQMDAGVSIEESRKRLEDMVAKMHPAPSWASYAPLTLRGVSAELTAVAGSTPGKVILYLHGGAFTMGSAAQDRHLTAEMAKRAGVEVVAVDYRLSPENRFPAALEDCVAAYRGLLETGYGEDDVAIVGVSAGGTLALAATLALKDRGVPLPRAVVAVSAATYFDSDEGSHSSNKAKDVVLGGGDFVFEVMGYYAPGEDPSNPYVSPLYGDYAGFSPMFVVVGTDEIVYDDSRLLVEKAAQSGVDVVSITGHGMPHAYPVFFDIFPEAAAAFGEICEYVRGKLAPRTHRPRLG